MYSMKLDIVFLRKMVYAGNKTMVVEVMSGWHFLGKVCRIEKQRAQEEP